MQKVWVLFILKLEKEIFFEAERPKDFDTLIKSLKKASI